MRHARTPKFQLSGPTVHSLYCDGGVENSPREDPIANRCYVICSLTPHEKQLAFLAIYPISYLAFQVVYFYHLTFEETIPGLADDMAE